MNDYQNEFLYRDYKNDESIIREFADIKMMEDVQSIVNECQDLLKLKKNDIPSNDVLYFSRLINNILQYFNKNSTVSTKQKRCLCRFIAEESFWGIGPIAMEEIIELHAKNK